MAGGMVDISGKPVIFRKAAAQGRITLKKETVEAVKAGAIRKGDPLSAARIAAISAVKKTPELLAFCHTIPIDSVEVDFEVERSGVKVTVNVSAWAKTGVEMEALLGVANALNTIWDMTKYLEKDPDGQYPGTVISDIRVTEKLKLDLPPGPDIALPTHRKHKQEAPSSLAIAVVTVSTSRTPETDVSGDLLKEIAQNHGHSAGAYAVVPDSEKEIAGAVKKFLEEGADAVIVNGGTGLDPTDVTIEALEKLFAKKITAFGQLLAQLSFTEIGTAFVTSRATAGIIGGKPVFCIPGSPAACRLAAEKLILPELGHIVKHSTGT